ncbi:hypothetical protein NM688_g7004 [Phlebia brevispora]|uniref:Uncharacterized protein n=1 Tax=Phlebia brevispora TaxID=194682 RepID=A0ACC1SA54_9APHY|nr:hypothetical protein NM688_g7004 [Phlebia brevispora]
MFSVLWKLFLDILVTSEGAQGLGLSSATPLLRAYAIQVLVSTCGHLATFNIEVDLSSDYSRCLPESHGNPAIQKMHTDPKFLQNHLSLVPGNARVTFSGMPSQQKALLRSITGTDEPERTLYWPFSDFLTYLSGRIYDSLPVEVKKDNAVIEFVPNGNRYMVGHPDTSELATPSAPECVGVEGSRAEFLVGRRLDGTPEYGTIPYHRVSTFMKIKPGNRHRASQLISYACHYLQARPDRPGVYCLAACSCFYQMSWVDSSGSTISPQYEWKNGRRYQLDPLLCFLYSLYVPPVGHITKDPTINVHHVKTHRKPTWDICSGGKTYEKCKLVSCQPPWGRRTAVFLHVKEGQETVIKDYYRNNKRRFKEEDIINQCHSDGFVPGVVRLEYHGEVKANGEAITTAPRAELESSNDHISECRTKMRFIFSSIGQKLDKVSSLKELLMVFFDLNEIHRGLLHAGVLHWDISANNILIRPKHRSSKGDVQLSSNPKLISDILWTETTKTTEDRSTCLLIDFDNSANLSACTQNATESVKVLAQRTGTPMYIARSIAAGTVLAKQRHRKFYPMPELSGKAKELYDDAWGPAHYEEYCDRNGTYHGSIVPDHTTLRALYTELSTMPVCHRPHHDVESMFWTLFVTVLKAVPKSDLEDVQLGEFLSTWEIFEKHTISTLQPTAVDARDVILRDLVDDGPECLTNILHPAFFKTPLPKLLAGLAVHISPEYDLLQDVSKADHLHEAWRRLLLECLVEIDDSPELDVELDPGARRGRKLKRGRLNISNEEDADSDDDEDSRGKPRPRTAEP